MRLPISPKRAQISTYHVHTERQQYYSRLRSSWHFMLALGTLWRHGRGSGLRCFSPSVLGFDVLEFAGSVLVTCARRHADHQEASWYSWWYKSCMTPQILHYHSSLGMGAYVPLVWFDLWLLLASCTKAWTSNGPKVSDSRAFGLKRPQITGFWNPRTSLLRYFGCWG